MKITKRQRGIIAKSQNISDIIGSKLKENDKNNDSKVDLSKIAKDLTARRKGVINENED